MPDYTLGDFGDQLGVGGFGGSGSSGSFGGGGGMDPATAAALSQAVGGLVGGIAGLFGKGASEKLPVFRWGEPYQDLGFGRTAQTMNNWGNPMASNYLKSNPGAGGDFTKLFGAGAPGQEAFPGNSSQAVDNVFKFFSPRGGQGGSQVPPQMKGLFN